MLTDFCQVHHFLYVRGTSRDHQCTWIRNALQQQEHNPALYRDDILSDQHHLVSSCELADHINCSC